MRIFQIRKKSGKFRTIYQPNEEEQKALRAIELDLQASAIKCNCYGVQHGFQPNRSSVTNALQHCGYRYSVSFDLQDFFDSVTELQVIDALTRFDFTARWPPNICYPDGAARQGLCTSPSLANIAASPMDADILRFVLGRPPTRRKLESSIPMKKNCIYTRYADDLTFSFDLPMWIERLKENIPMIVEKHGFKINPAKTKVQASKAGRRIITGVAVDDKCYAPRETRRRLRAALHQGHINEAQGLKEWCKLRMPKQYDNQKNRTKVVPLKLLVERNTQTPTVANTKGGKTVPADLIKIETPKRKLQLND